MWLRAECLRGPLCSLGLCGGTRMNQKVPLQLSIRPSGPYGLPCWDTVSKGSNLETLGRAQGRRGQPGRASELSSSTAGAGEGAQRGQGGQVTCFWAMPSGPLREGLWVVCAGGP